MHRSKNRVDWRDRVGGLERQGGRIGETGWEDWTDRVGGLERQSERVGETGGRI
jgi:hypothetical protein